VKDRKVPIEPEIPEKLWRRLIAYQEKFDQETKEVVVEALENFFEKEERDKGLYLDYEPKFSYWSTDVDEVENNKALYESVPSSVEIHERSKQES